jgi:hypothetical protein
MTEKERLEHEQEGLIVMMHPPGSRPGIISFAVIPAINPNTIQAMIPKTSSFTAAAKPSRFYLCLRNLQRYRSTGRARRTARDQETVR